MSECSKHCLHNPNGPFTCKFCSRSCPPLHNLVANRRNKNPARGGTHSPVY